MKHFIAFVHRPVERSFAHSPFAFQHPARNPLNNATPTGVAAFTSLFIIDIHVEYIDCQISFFTNAAAAALNKPVNVPSWGHILDTLTTPGPNYQSISRPKVGVYVELLLPQVPFDSPSSTLLALSLTCSFSRTV